MEDLRIEPLAAIDSLVRDIAARMSPEGLRALWEATDDERSARFTDLQALGFPSTGPARDRHTLALVVDDAVRAMLGRTEPCRNRCGNSVASCDCPPDANGDTCPHGDYCTACAARNAGEVTQ